MGFASLLEDLVDIQNELDHFAHAVARNGAVRSRAQTGSFQEEYENPEFVDAQEVNRFYRSQLKLVKRFVDYYKQERQVLEQHRSQLPAHLATVDQIDKVLQPVATLESWDDDEGRWNVVLGIEKQLNRLVRERSIASALSPQLLEHLQASARHAQDQAIKLKRTLDDALSSPIDSRTSNDVRDDLTSCASLLEFALPSFVKDFAALTEAMSCLQGLRKNWEIFLDLYKSLPLRLQRRLTIKELSRLNLHEDQEQFVSLNHSGCFQLGGVSGSGKSIILVNRALRLSRECPARTVHVLTINRSLATQLGGTLEVVGRGALPSNLKVGSLYDLFHRCITVCYPADKHRLFDDRSGERIEQSWNDFVAHKGRTVESNVFADRKAQKLLNYLERRLKRNRRAAFEYLRDEVQCVQSAYLRKDRQQYLDEMRLGRAFTLQGSQRHTILRIVEAWEEWLDAGGLSDIHTVSLTAAELLTGADTKSKIRTQVKADLVLVDEAQDLSTVELIALRQLIAVPDDTNALFLTGDVCQKVYSKHQALERAGFGESQSTAVLKKNFRNTKQILTAAFRTIAAFPPPVAVVQGSITKPEVSPYSGSKPLAVNCFGKAQAECIRDIVRDIAQERVAVVTENQSLLNTLLRTLNDEPTVNCVHVQSNADIDRWRDIPASPSEIAVFLSTFDAVKGFEFDTVIVADVSSPRDENGDTYEGVPPIGMPEGDFWRCATKFYAACTRARNHLIVTYVGSPSILLKNANQDFEWIRAEDRRLFDVIVGKHEKT